MASEGNAPRKNVEAQRETRYLGQHVEHAESEQAKQINYARERQKALADFKAETGNASQSTSQAWADACLKAEAQRDELLAELKALASAVSDDSVSVEIMAKACAAIAKSETRRGEAEGRIS